MVVKYRENYVRIHVWCSCYTYSAKLSNNQDAPELKGKVLFMNLFVGLTFGEFNMSFMLSHIYSATIDGVWIDNYIYCTL
jgi:hypothetical protein